MLVLVGSFVSKTQPAKFVFAVVAVHVHAACVLVDVDITLRTLLSIALLPLNVQFINNLVNVFSPFLDHFASDWLMAW